jgi:hypothetical protein
VGSYIEKLEKQSTDTSYGRMQPEGKGSTVIIIIIIIKEALTLGCYQ